MRAGFDPFRRGRLPVLIAALSLVGAAGSIGESFFYSREVPLFSGRGLSPSGGAWAATPQPPRRPDQFDQPASPSTTPVNEPKFSPSKPSQAPQSKQPQALPSKSPQAAPVGRAPVDVDVDKLQPYNLPPAPRERMRQCGEEWRKLKSEGKSAGLIWRGFAEKCLIR
jgi:hypothetical protein